MSEENNAAVCTAEKPNPLYAWADPAVCGAYCAIGNGGPVLPYKGGHYRVLCAADGRKLAEASMQPFSGGMMTCTVSQPPGTVRGGIPAGPLTYIYRADVLCVLLTKAAAGERLPQPGTI